MAKNKKTNNEDEIEIKDEAQEEDGEPKDDIAGDTSASIIEDVFEEPLVDEEETLSLEELADKEEGEVDMFDYMNNPDE